MQYNDPDFGTVTVTVNPRARNIIMRPVVGGLCVTACPGVTLAFVKEVLEKRRTTVIQKKQIYDSQERPCYSPEQIEQLRKLAKQYLPQRTAELARQWGFTFKGVKVQPSRTRWGSCSTSCSINFSLYLVTVPSHLIDYVILHELCHTKHHDHSAAFWAEMNRVTDNKAWALRKELGNYYMPKR